MREGDNSHTYRVGGGEERIFNPLAHSLKAPTNRTESDESQRLETSCESHLSSQFQARKSSSASFQGTGLKVEAGLHLRHSDDM